MIQLTKIRLVNWHYFIDATIPVGQFCLLAGDNGSGKSTIVDAIQFLMASDLRKARFNASAHDRRGGRTLEGYVRCKLGTESTDFLRDDTVAHVMLEFTEDKTVFAAGVCVDAWKDGKIQSRFWISDNLDITQIEIKKEDGKPLISRQFIDSLSIYNASSYESGIAFRRDFTGRLGIWRRMSENNPYIDAFVRSIHFTPLTSVDQFVCNYILEEQLIDLSVMKQNLESYRQAEDLAKATRDRINFLKKIIAIGEDCVNQERIIVQQDWLKHELDVRKITKKREDLETKKKLNETSLEANNKEQTLINEKLIILNREKQDTELSLSQNDTQVLYKNLSQQLEDKHLRLDELSQKVAKYKNLFEQAITGYALLFPTKKIKDEDFTIAEIEQLQETSQREAILIDQEISSAKETLNVIRSELYELERGKLKLPDSNAKLLEALHKAGYEAWCLADLAEVKDPDWADAVEGWLNTLRLACIVSPDIFAQALTIYDSLPRNIAGVPLPDIGKMSSDFNTSKVREGSLAQIVTTENPWARAYIDCILGDVMMADLSSLRNYKKAITKECMSWSRYTAIRIKEEVYKQPWLGKQAREKRKTMLIANRGLLLKRIEELEQTKTGLIEKLLVCKNLIHTVAELDFLKESLVLYERTQAEIKELTGKRDALDISSFKPLQERINQLILEIKEANTIYRELIASSGRLKEKIESSLLEIEQLKEEQESAKQSFALFKTEHELFAQDCERYVEERLKNKDEATILTNFASARKTVETKKQNSLRNFTFAVAEYNNLYNELFAAEIQEIQNFIHRKTKLQDSELPDYIEKIRKARLDAEFEFKNHFIARLNELIEEAKESFSDINASLKQMTFGHDQYRFTLTEKNERRGQIEIIRKTAQISDYENSLFDALIQPEDKQAANELFNRILNSDLQSAELRSICDYRTYFTYDIRVKDSQSLDPNTGHYAEYSLSKVIKEKSGGEAQTPYYVAIAASFFRFYRDKNIPTIRFVLFDEAFDRLDDGRIAKVLSFYRDLGLQIIISVPTEKIESIAPFMDSVNLVIRHGHTAGVVDFYQKPAEPRKNNLHTEQQSTQPAMLPIERQS